jgi:putative serine/threonine protein kinase
MESGKSPQMQSERASLDLLTKTPYIQILTYPRISLKDARSRIRQLRELGVEEIVFEGPSKVGRLGILGLGTVGVVVKAESGGRLFALKIRRIDANRPNMEGEVGLTRLVNRVGVGPQIYGSTRDMILMELLDPQELADWVRGLKGGGKREAVRSMVHSLLNQCRKLDIMGVDHGQLSNLRKHAVISGERVLIIDFESASRGRRPRNVTTAAQYLFVGGALSPSLRRALGIRDTEPLKVLLAQYKKGLSDYSYSKILEILRIAAD